MGTVLNSSIASGLTSVSIYRSSLGRGIDHRRAHRRPADDRVGGHSLFRREQSLSLTDEHPRLRIDDDVLTADALGVDSADGGAGASLEGRLILDDLDAGDQRCGLVESGPNIRRNDSLAQPVDDVHEGFVVRGDSAPSVVR